MTKISGDAKVFYPSATRYGERFPGLDPDLLEFDRNGSIWVAFFSNALGRLKDGDWQLYSDSVWNIIGHEPIHALKSGPDNAIWVGTSEGLAILGGASVPLSAPTLPPATADALLSFPHPNPASGDIGVSITIRSRTCARLALIDELGRTVAVPLEGTLDPGEHALTIPTDGIPAGGYFLRLETVGGVAVRPLRIIH